MCCACLRASGALPSPSPSLVDSSELRGSHPRVVPQPAAQRMQRPRGLGESRPPTAVRRMGGGGAARDETEGPHSREVGSKSRANSPYVTVLCPAYSEHEPRAWSCADLLRSSRNVRHAHPSHPGESLTTLSHWRVFYNPLTLKSLLQPSHTEESSTNPASARG